MYSKSISIIIQLSLQLCFCLFQCTTDNLWGTSEYSSGRHHLQKYTDVSVHNSNVDYWLRNSTVTDDYQMGLTEYSTAVDFVAGPGTSMHASFSPVVSIIGNQRSLYSEVNNAVNNSG